ncbi:uncharacterized protein LOC110266008 isoform X1 [Arachis ipaensis]|uniref:uncharacterized protein LOC110266008 isoform X1 n=1 Tax=Arachis ipaensis TaxID=130454 RepID=UPI000A2B421D|nr:uncharacterized protein LOC110266008 isoform X1 [Arachis ipaensis]
MVTASFLLYTNTGTVATSLSNFFSVTSCCGCCVRGLELRLQLPQELVVMGTSMTWKHLPPLIYALAFCLIAINVAADDDQSPYYGCHNSPYHPAPQAAPPAHEPHPPYMYKSPPPPFSYIYKSPPPTIYQQISSSSLSLSTLSEIFYYILVRIFVHVS